MIRYHLFGSRRANLGSKIDSWKLALALKSLSQTVLFSNFFSILVSLFLSKSKQFKYKNSFLSTVPSKAGKYTRSSGPYFGWHSQF